MYLWEKPACIESIGRGRRLKQITSEQRALETAKRRPFGTCETLEAY